MSSADFVRLSFWLNKTQAIMMLLITVTAWCVVVCTICISLGSNLTLSSDLFRYPASCIKHNLLGGSDFQYPLHISTIDGFWPGYGDSGQSIFSHPRPPLS